MSSCEMCGKETSLLRAVIESVTMAVCKNCAHHGKVSYQPPPTSNKQRNLAPLKKEEEPLEQVRHDFAQVLKGERNKRNMTQTEFAHLLLERDSTYTHYENGTLKPSIEAARRMEKILKTPLVEVVSGESEFEIKKPTTATGMTIGDMMKTRQR